MTRKSQNPAYPDAHPTAPGGMSQKQLVSELVTHGYSKDTAEQMSWPEMIEAVIESRREVELRANKVSDQSDTDQDLDDLVGPAIPSATPEEFQPDDDDDFDSLMADLEELVEDDEGIPTCAICEVKGEHPRTDHSFIDAAYYDPDSDIGEPEDMLADLDALTSEPVVIPEIVDLIQKNQPASLFLGIPHTRDYIFDGHKGTGPSAAERWMECTASLGAARAFLETLTPNQQIEYASGNTAARQGTTAHAVAETQARVLLGTMSPEEADAALMELAIHPVEGEDYDEEMEGYVAEYVDYVKSYVDEGRNVLIEEHVTASIPLLAVDAEGNEATYDITGSLDLGVLPEAPDPNYKRGKRNPKPERQRLVVGDLKYGEGVNVDVESNPQIRIYALGLLARVVEMFDGLPEWLTDIDYVIVQPRLGGIKVWTEKVDDLLAWQDEVLRIVLTEALGGQRAGAKFSPSESACQWCPARGGCPALLAERQGAASELFDVMIENDGDGFPETGTLSDADLAKFYTQVTGLTKLAKEMKEELQRRAYRGQKIPGYYLANYTPPRYWKDEAGEELDPGNRDEGRLTEEQAAQLWTPPTLVSPAAAEKILGKENYKRVEELVIKPDKRPVIAPDGDRRSAWTGVPPEQMFDIED